MMSLSTMSFGSSERGVERVSCCERAHSQLRVEFEGFVLAEKSSAIQASSGADEKSAVLHAFTCRLPSRLI